MENYYQESDGKYLSNSSEDNSETSLKNNYQDSEDDKFDVSFLF